MAGGPERPPVASAGVEMAAVTVVWRRGAEAELLVTADVLKDTVELKSLA